MQKHWLVVLSLVILGFSIAAAQQRAAPSGTIQGVWRVVEVTTTGPDAQTNRQPQPGFYIFTARHYAVLTVNSDKPRPDVPADIAKATADQLRAGWDPFTANAGTYDVSGGMLTTRPLVAKNPQVMRGGTYATRSMKLEGSTLTVTQVRDQAGPIANPITVRLTRAE